VVAHDHHGRRRCVCHRHVHQGTSQALSVDTPIGTPKLRVGEAPPEYLTRFRRARILSS
jgi:hypothetical protein